NERRTKCRQRKGTVKTAALIRVAMMNPVGLATATQDIMKAKEISSVRKTLHSTPVIDSTDRSASSIGTIQTHARNSSRTNGYEGLASAQSRALSRYGTYR